MHKLNISKEVKPVKQDQRRTKPEIMGKIEREIQKLQDTQFIWEEQHPDLLANIVLVTKKNGQIGVCNDFRDLNKACPKDDFPLHIPEIMIDNTFGYERMPFMDGFSGYNQFKMSLEGVKRISFKTPFGVYCFTVMPFGLKNAGATYQRVMTKIFQDI